MFVIEGLVIYYAITQFIGDMFTMARPFQTGVETIILIGAAVVSYCEYTKFKNRRGDKLVIHELLLDNTARDGITMLIYAVLAMAFSDYWQFFLSCSAVAGCFFFYRRRLCKKWAA